MIDKKTLALAVAISWALTLVTVLLISHFAPSLTQPFTEQFVSLQSVKVVNLQKQEEMNMQGMGVYVLNVNFTWSPTSPHNNTILGVVGSFEYSINTQIQGDLDITYALYVNYPSLGFFESSSGTLNCECVLRRLESVVVFVGTNVLIAEESVAN